MNDAVTAGVCLIAVDNAKAAAALEERLACVRAVADMINKYPDLAERFGDLAGRLLLGSHAPPLTVREAT